MEPPYANSSHYTLIISSHYTLTISHLGGGPFEAGESAFCRFRMITTQNTWKPFFFPFPLIFIFIDMASAAADLCIYLHNTLCYYVRDSSFI